MREKTSQMRIVSIVFALLVLMGSDPAVALAAHPAAPRCDSCSPVERVQQLDCSSLAQVEPFRKITAKDESAVSRYHDPRVGGSSPSSATIVK